MFLEPEEIMVFEDSPAGIEAAERFGAGKIVIINSTGNDCSKYDDTLVLEDINDSLSIIDLNIVLPREDRYLLE